MDTVGRILSPPRLPFRHPGTEVEIKRDTVGDITVPGNRTGRAYTNNYVNRH